MYSKYSRVQLNKHEVSEDVGGIHQEFLDRHTTDDTLRSEDSNAGSQSNGPNVAEESNMEQGEGYMQMPIQESSACQCQCYHWCCSVCSSCCGALYYQSCIGPCNVGYMKATETTSTECKSCECGSYEVWQCNNCCCFKCQYFPGMGKKMLHCDKRGMCRSCCVCLHHNCRPKLGCNECSISFEVKLPSPMFP